MKQCPQCRTTYTDNSLRYCLADGSELFQADDEQETIAARRDQKVRVDIGHDGPTVTPATTTARPQSTSVLKIVAIIALIGLLLVFTVAGIGTLIYFGAKNDSANSAKNIAVNTSPTPDLEKQRLQNELANIQKRLDEQQKNANRGNFPSPSPTPNSPGIVTARVNSPNDGFLAMRDQPDADRGERLVKIPHGSTVTIENCQRNTQVVGNRSGRWCLVTWNGYKGYVFDAWLIY